MTLVVQGPLWGKQCSSAGAPKLFSSISNKVGGKQCLTIVNFFSLPQVQNLNVAPAAAASICYNVCTYYVGYNVDVMRSKIDMRV